MTLPMTNDEICAMYRDAADKGKQIGILADLNCTDKDVIREILIDNGMMKKPGRPSTGPKPRKPEVKQVCTGDPVRVTDRLSVPAGTPLTKIPDPPEVVIKAVKRRIADVSAKLKEYSENIDTLNQAIKDMRHEHDELIEWLKSLHREYEA